MSTDENERPFDRLREAVCQHVDLARAALTDTGSAGDGPDGFTVPCAYCERPVDTREESEGGDKWGVQINDDRWACSSGCYDMLIQPAPTVQEVAPTVEAAREWQPIETAPEDGSEVVLLCDGSPAIGRFEPEQDGFGQCGWYSQSDDWLGGFCAPTHWAPLPRALSQQEEGGT